MDGASLEMPLAVAVRPCQLLLIPTPFYPFASADL